MRHKLGGVVLTALGIMLLAWPALAHPVRIGRYAEIPYGIDPAHPYPAAGGGPQRAGRVRGTFPSVAPALMWEHTFRYRLPRGPAVAADGTLYFGTRGGLTSLAPDGTERWSLNLGPVRAAPSLAPGGDVVVVTSAGLVARVSSEGEVRHQAQLDAPAHGPALVLDDGSVLVGTIDQRVLRLDSDLRRVHTVHLRSGSALALSVVARGLIAAPAGRMLVLLDGGGRIEREIPLGGHSSGPVAVADDGTLWLATAEGSLLAIERNGRIRSRTQLGTIRHDGPWMTVGRDGAVRVPTATEGIVCVGPGGAVRWRFSTGAGFGPASIDDEDTTLAVDMAGRISAIGADGTLRWQMQLGSYSLEAPVLGPDGTLYVTTRESAVQAWRAP